MRRSAAFARFAAVAAAAAMAVAPAAFADDRTPAQRQDLIDLAYVIGESHALRQACTGEGDQYWRARMLQLMEVEAPEQGFANRLTQAFNAGFAAGQAGFPACDAKARAEAGRAAAKGRRLAARLGPP